MDKRDFTIFQTQFEDRKALWSLYKSVAENSGGIIRTASEINYQYINDFLEKSLATGFSLHIKHPQDPKLIIGEIHTYQYGLKAFRHILTDLTIVINPDFQGRGFGKKLFSCLLDKVKKERSDILRVELFVRKQNTSARRFYFRLGFKEEGYHTHKIKNSDNSLETPVHMAWFNPNYVN